MLSSVEHEKRFITSGPDYNLMTRQLTSTVCCSARYWLEGINTTCYQREASVSNFIVIPRSPVRGSGNALNFLTALIHHDFFFGFIFFISKIDQYNKYTYWTSSNSHTGHITYIYRGTRDVLVGQLGTDA